MRKMFIAGNRSAAEQAAPWAAEIVECEGGHQVFESTTEAARYLSDMASEVYGNAGCPGAFVKLVDGGYELHEPSPNAFPVVFATADDCSRAINQFDA